MRKEEQMMSWLTLSSVSSYIKKLLFLIHTPNKFNLIYRMRKIALGRS
jgi:hypothetical protein